MEIERKFLLKRFPNIDIYKKVYIEQYYVSFDNEVRVRKIADTNKEDFILTIKSNGDLAREEVEISINKDQFGVLKEIAGDNYVIKTRYYLKDDYLYEVDIYDDLSGLKVVEVEFDSLEDANKFIKPDWLGKEITDDSTYKNKNLAKYGRCC